MNQKPSQALVGRRVRLISCKNPFNWLRSGTEGTVERVDESAGVVYVKWDGRINEVSGLIWTDGDRWVVIPNPTVNNDTKR